MITLGRMLSTLVFACLVVGCGGNGAEPEASSDACSDVLADEMVERFLSDVPEAVFDPIEGLSRCAWDQPDGRLLATWAPADEWAKALPAMFDEAERSGVLDDRATSRKFDRGRQLLASGGVTPDQACDMFTTMVVEIQGAPPGSDTIVNIIPDREEPLGANAQSCVDGQYVSVQFQGPDISLGDGIEKDLIAAATAVRRKSDRSTLSR